MKDNKLKKFRKMLNAFDSEVFHAKNCNELHFDLAYNNRHLQGENWEEVYSIAPSFFTESRKGIQDRLFMIIGRLYESKNRSDYNIEKVINFAIANSKSLYPQDYTKLNEISNELLIEFKNLKITVDKILYFRDKVIGHNGKEHFLNRIEKNYPEGASFDEYNKLLQFAGDVFNRYNNLIFQQISVTEAQNDVNNLITHCLKNNNDYNSN